MALNLDKRTDQNNNPRKVKWYDNLWHKRVESRSSFEMMKTFLLVICSLERKMEKRARFLKARAHSHKDLCMYVTVCHPKWKKGESLQPFRASNEYTTRILVLSFLFLCLSLILLFLLRER